MKKSSFITLAALIFASVLFALSGCKSVEQDSESNRISIDISGLKKSLVTPSSAQSASVNGPNYVAVTESQAQESVLSLLIAPITHSAHGKPYSSDEPFTDDVGDDLEDDAPNSANYIQFIDLPTDQNYVDVEVPSISDGWQLVAAAFKTRVTNIDDMTDEANDNAIAYIGFTEKAYTSVDDFNANPVTLKLKRACNQDNPPKGCAAYDTDKDPILTAAVEIHDILINGASIEGSLSGWSLPGFPWVVRSNDVSDNVSTYRQHMDSIVSNYGEAAINQIMVKTTHQLSAAFKGTACEDATGDAILTKCGNTQDYKFIYK